jgi:hypothetical protein
VLAECGFQHLAGTLLLRARFPRSFGVKDCS